MRYSRRQFIQQNLLATGTFLLPFPAMAKSQVLTVRGPIPADSMGTTLVHEHVLVDFIGADKIAAGRYNRKEVFDSVLPHLRDLRRRGCKTLVECTPQWLGRDPLLLRELSGASDLHIITNTGYYGAAGEKFLPASLQTTDAARLSSEWIAEYKQGIGDTKIKPGFMKLGVDDLPFSEGIQKILQAGALTFRTTGLPIAIHTSKGGNPAREELRLLTENGVPADAFIWVHAQNERDPAVYEEMARAGAWVELDGYHRDQTDIYVAMLLRLKIQRCWHRILVSQDAGWYHVGEPGGGSFRPYLDIFDSLLPAMRKSGFTEEDINQLMVLNPSAAFSLRSL